MRLYSIVFKLLSVFLICFSQMIAAGVIVDLEGGETISIHQQIDKQLINVDGHLNEGIWSQLPAYDEFVVIEPDTLAQVPHATLVKLFYNDAGLYVGIEMEQPKDTIIRRLSGRDLRDLNRDSINLTLDTSGEGRYGYFFGVNLGDTLMDGTVLPEKRFSSDWDGAWRGASQETDVGWSAEMFIPWGTVTMPVTGEVRRLGLYMSRKVAYLDERWGWPGLTSTQPKFMSALQTVEVKGVNPRKQYSIFPFTAVGYDLIEGRNRYKSGADFFWRPSSNLQISGTVNPDFGNVESDDVVINLSATETFFPEKRLFFLEGQEVFVASPRADTRGGGVGMRGLPYTMVNTRRIGGKPRPVDLAPGESIEKREQVQPIDLLGAVKLTGQNGPIRYGFLAAFEEDLHLNGSSADVPIRVNQTGSDYGIARFIYEDTHEGAYRAVGFLTTAVLHSDGDALAQGLDAHYLSANGKLKLDGQFISTDVEDIDRGFGGFVDAEYTIRQGVVQRIGIEYFDENIDINDLGFLQSNDYYQIRSAHSRTNSGLGWARNNQFDVRGSLRRNPDGLFTGGGVLFSDRLTFNNLSSLTLKASFFPKSFDALNSFGNGIYRIEKKREFVIRYSSPETGRFSFGGGVGLREEALGGNQISIGGGLNWRPSDQLSFRLSFSWADRDGWLLHQEDKNFTTFKAEQWVPSVSIEYFLTAKQQLKISMQWVGIRAQEDEFFLIPDEPDDLIKTTKPPGPSDSFGLSQMSFQIRYRWELAPLSDLFVVYTRSVDKGFALQDNTFSDLFEKGFNDPIGDVFVIKLRYRFGS